jgi:hypothetical protein
MDQPISLRINVMDCKVVESLKRHITKGCCTQCTLKISTKGNQTTRVNIFRLSPPFNLPQEGAIPASPGLHSTSMKMFGKPPLG